MTGITWVVESKVFPARYQRFREAVRQSGHELIEWDDDWWETGRIPALAGRFVMFHGSLGNADRIARDVEWSPGSFCEAAAFHCSSYYEQCREWLVHEDFSFTTVQDLVGKPQEVDGRLARTGRVFVRPDSPLKPFSGRVVELSGLTPASLDHGFYYDDYDLPIVVAPVQQVSEEWRFVRSPCGR